MNILMVCSEYAPLAKTGGLADAVAGLSEALADRGHDLRVLLPKYAHLTSVAGALTPIADPSGRFQFVELPSAPKKPRVYLVELMGPIEDVIYAGDERDALRFLQLSVAALRLGDALGWRPDVLHCHDWQTALVPALPGARNVAPTVLTIHNMGHQGAYGVKVLAGNGYADLTPLIDPRARAKRAINYLRAGIGAAAAITTVSPTYAREICTRQQGMGLQDVIAARAGDLVGLLNGVDESIWTPERDPFLQAHFSAENLAPKRSFKLSLARRLGLVADSNTPLIAVVSRLEPQKGIDLLIGAIPILLRQTSAVFAIHGAGRAKLAGKLMTLARKYPSRISFTSGYQEPLAHEVLAAGDLLLMPSRYEPCGLTQLYALRYGTIPVVRRTGGLADTIEPFDPATGRGTGILFERPKAGDLKVAVIRALQWFNAPELWSRLVANAMRADFSWRVQVRNYEALYRRVASSSRETPRVDDASKAHVAA